MTGRATSSIAIERVSNTEDTRSGRLQTTIHLVIHHFESMTLTLAAGLSALVGYTLVLAGFLLGLLGLNQLFLFQRWQALMTTAGVLPTVITLLLLLSCRRPGSGHVPHLEEGPSQIPEVIGQPVDQHGEGEVDAGEDVHDREDKGHHLLHLVLLALNGRSRNVVPEVV